MFRDFLTALHFLTLFSVSKKSSGSLARAMIFFPFVGLLIGILSWALFTLSQSVFPERFSVLVLLAAPVLISGGLHVDGFADFCDGFFGGKDKPEILRIMKDPHVGTWAVLGVIFLMFAKFELLETLPYKLHFFILAIVCSRWAQVALSFFLPYAGTGGGLSESVAQKIGIREFAGASILLIPLFFWVPMSGIFIFLALLIFLAALALFFRRKIGGITGDLLGAASELSELFIYVAVATVVK